MTEARAPSRGDLTLFLSVAFGGPFTLCGVAYLAGVRLTPFTAIALGVPYMFFPALGAWLAERRRGARVIDSLEVRFKPNAWWLAGWLSPLVLAGVAFGIALLLPGVSLTTGFEGVLERFGDRLSPEKLSEAKRTLESLPLSLLVGSTLLQALTLGPTINAIAAFGEELGWRGYLQRTFAPLGFWRASFLIGLLWGPWHAALIVQGYNYPQHPFIGVAMMTAMTVLLSPLIAAVRVHGKSVIAAAVMHGTINAAAGFAVLFIRGGNDLLVGLTGLAGLLTLALANGVLWWVLRGIPSRNAVSAAELR